MAKRSTKKLSTREIVITVLFLLYIGFLMLPAAAPVAKELRDEAEDNPLFGLSGVDIDRFVAETKKLKKNTRVLADVYSNSKDKNIILRALHPLEFLEELGELEQSRRDFVTRPSFFRWLLYRNNLRKTVAEYKEDVAAFRAALGGLEGGERYRFIDSTTSLAALSSVVEDFRINAEFLNLEIHGEGDEIEFDTPSEYWQESSSDRPLTKSELKDLAFMRRFIESHDGWKILAQSFEVPTDCFGSFGDFDLFYPVALRNEIVPVYYRPAYFDYQEARFSDSRYYEPLRKANFDYYWQPDFNLYICPDSAYQTEVLTLYKIADLLRNYENSGNSFSSKTSEVTAVEAAIHNFLAEDPVRRSTQRILFSSIDELFSRYEKKERKALLGNERARMLSEVRLLVQQKSGFLEEIVARGARLTGNLPELMSRLPEPLGVDELLVMRSYPSVYFLPFNHSVWRRVDPPSFITSVERSPYYYDRQKLERTYSEEEILELMRISAHLIRL